MVVLRYSVSSPILAPVASETQFVRVAVYPVNRLETARKSHSWLNGEDVQVATGFETPPERPLLVAQPRGWQRGGARGRTIPYRCLVPRRVENLPLGGRNIPGTHLAQPSYWAMSIYANLVRAAGIAAASCVKQRCSPRALKVEDLQAVLRTQGVEP